MIRSLTFIILSLMYKVIFAQSLDYYLPSTVSYNPQIPTPAEVIGHEVGEWHVTHDKLVYYMRKLAESSDRVSYQEFGETHEGRAQSLLIITSKENHRNIDQIREDHVLLTDPARSGQLDVQKMPAVVWQGYSIHGNEASGSNASLLAAYYYAAAKGEEIEALLEEVVILLDPSFNPDGMTRFSTWVNSRKSQNLVADRYNMEQNEYWPGGRTNHYWFDLNRDWLPVQQPESQNRIKMFHHWKPNILTDHHEMGTNATFFFQPGIPSRNNPNTPQNNFILTEEIATYHGEALDRIGSLYYSKESYDDFYYGKGSTFPDINGGIGILFEQASSRGHLQESIHGDLDFPFTIKNQFVTSLSTVEAAKEMRPQLLEYQRNFFVDALAESQKSAFEGIIFGSSFDPVKSRELANVLSQHKIEVQKINKDVSIDGKKYKGGSSYFVPLQQSQYRLIDIMFETVTDFRDSLFYDVSAWTLPMAFGLNYKYLNEKEAGQISDRSEFSNAQAEIAFDRSDYAYVIKWGNYYAPSVLYKLLDEGIICKIANETFSDGQIDFNRGSILIPVKMQDMDAVELYKVLENVAGTYEVAVHSLSTGTTSGVFLGSRSFDKAIKPSIFMLVEGGVRSYDAGEIWHLLDNRMDIELTLMPFRVLDYADITRYNTLIMPDGRYSGLNGRSAEKIKNWIQAGGNVIAMERANQWLKQQGIVKLEYVKENTEIPSVRTDYEFIDEYTGAQATGGAIFTGDVDISNPIAYGYTDRKQYLFVSNNNFIVPSENKYADPVVFSSNPLASGYVSEESLERMTNSSAIRTSKSGRGKIISFAFNPNFRAFWYGTNSLFLNTIFFIDILDSDSME